MRSLEQFWHWWMNERPVLKDQHLDTLSEAASQALALACEAIDERLGEDWPEIAGVGEDLRQLVPLLNDVQLEACRDLSLAICAALETMHEAVPEAPKTRVNELLEEQARIMAAIDKTEAESPAAEPWCLPPGHAAMATSVEMQQRAADASHARDMQRQLMGEKTVTIGCPDPSTVIGPEQYAALPEACALQNADQMALNERLEKLQALLERAAISGGQFVCWSAVNAQPGVPGPLNDPLPVLGADDRLKLLRDVCPGCGIARGGIGSPHGPGCKIPGDYVDVVPTAHIGDRYFHSQELKGTIRSVGCDHRTGKWTARVEWD